jgi:hypothetical protein
MVVPHRIPPPFAEQTPHCTPDFCINERGYKITQLHHEFPALAPFYTRFETDAFASIYHPWCER